MSGKKKILLFADWYEPAFKAGGPIRSCVNFVQHMREDYEIFVFTSDRDIGSTQALSGIVSNQWLARSGDLQVYYCDPVKLTWKQIEQEINRINPDFIYLNSMFSRYFTIYPLLISRKTNYGGKLILSPRGMLRSSALKFKSLRKKLFLSFFRLFGFQRKIYFHAADETETTDIRNCFGKKSIVFQIPNYPAVISSLNGSIEKKSGDLSIIYVGRIHPIKNIDFLIRVLEQNADRVRLTVVGGMEDPAFWKKCEALIRRLPANVEVRYEGEKRNEEIAGYIGRHHIFALPTRGENFGHAIFEALSSGKPVLISDQTPWRNLELAKAGWDFSLQHPEQFGKAISQAASWGQLEYDEWSRNAFEFAKRSFDIHAVKEKYRLLFA